LLEAVQNVLNGKGTCRFNDRELTSDHSR
jgi:hypothetical protein